MIVRMNGKIQFLSDFLKGMHFYDSNQPNKSANEKTLDDSCEWLKKQFSSAD